MKMFTHGGWLAFLLGLVFCLLLSLPLLAARPAAAAQTFPEQGRSDESGFVSIFDGRTLTAHPGDTVASADFS